MIKSILVPMGTTESSISAIKIAVKMANLLKADLQFLYVEDIDKIARAVYGYQAAAAGYSFDIKAFEFEKEKVEEEIKKEAALVKEFYEKYKKNIEGKHKLIAKTGIIPEEILKKIREADLVIMGKRIKKDEKGKLQSNVFNVIKKSNKPVIAVSKGEDLGKNFLVAYNKSRSANNSLKVLGEFIDYIKPEVKILTMNNKKEDAEKLIKEAEKYFLYYDVEIEKIWKDEKEVIGIIETIEEKDITCLVMGGYGDNKIKEFLLGKTTEKILEKVDIPVIVVNA